MLLFLFIKILLDLQVVIWPSIYQQMTGEKRDCKVCKPNCLHKRHTHSLHLACPIHEEQWQFVTVVELFDCTNLSIFTHHHLCWTALSMQFIIWWLIIYWNSKARKNINQFDRIYVWWHVTPTFQTNHSACVHNRFTSCKKALSLLYSFLLLSWILILLKRR